MLNHQQKTVELKYGLKALFATAIPILLDKLKPHVADSKSLTTGCGCFDRLTHAQQITAVHEVGIALLKRGEFQSCSPVYQHGTLHVLFDCIEEGITSEIVIDLTRFRSLVLLSHFEIYGFIEHGITCDCTDMVSWRALIGSIRRKMVDGGSLEISEQLFHLPPEESALLCMKHGICAEMHNASPDDPDYSRTVILAGDLFALCLNFLLKELQEIERIDTQEKVSRNLAILN